MFGVKQNTEYQKCDATNLSNLIYPKVDSSKHLNVNNSWMILAIQIDVCHTAEVISTIVNNMHQSENRLCLINLYLFDHFLASHLKLPSKRRREICLFTFTRMFQMFTKLNRDEGRRKCVFLCCNLFLSGWFCVYDRYHGWQLFVTLIFILGNVYGLIYHRTKGERAGVLCAFSVVFLNERDYNLANSHLVVIKWDLYMYIFAWLQKKSGACDKHSSSLLSLSVSVCLQVRRSHLELWVLLQKIAGFHRQGSKVGPFPAGSCFSTLKYIMLYNFYKRAWIIRAPSFTLRSFAFLPGPLYPLRLGWMRNQHLYKTPFYAWPKTPTPLNPFLGLLSEVGNP